jgi:hypothetical protein
MKKANNLKGKIKKIEGREGRYLVLLIQVHHLLHSY